ncbi:MAG: hypothetical protein R2713_02950 [Ilumatobacteraceae bacterium]
MTNVARRIWDVVEPIAANIYFAPEVHAAYHQIGFEPSTRSAGTVQYPDMVAYFTSRGACLGPNVDGHLVASAFGVFKRPMVVEAVAEGWRRADQATVLAARERGGVASLRRLLGDEPEGLAWATEVLQRMVDAAPGEGRALFSGLLSLGYPDDPMGAFWRAADLVREHRGDSHIAAWVGAELDACEIGVLTDPWRRQPLKSWVRSRGWTDDELDAACDRLRSRRAARRRRSHRRRAGHCARASTTRRTGWKPASSPRRLGCGAAVRPARPVVRPDRRRRRLPGAHVARLTAGDRGAIRARSRRGG